MTQEFDDHIVDVYLNTFTHYVAEDLIHQSLIHCPCIFEAEWHDFVEIVGVICDEGCFVHIGCGRGSLVVTRVWIKKTENFVNGCTVNYAVNVG